MRRGTGTYDGPFLLARAGTLLDGATHCRRDQSALSPHCERLDVRLLAPRELARAIADAAIGRHDTVIVGGGDGSVSAAVAAFSSSDKVLGVLPFGTMNLLARDLGMPSDPQAAVAALAAAVPRRIDLAEINGRPFHTLSGLGFFSHMARAREEVRGHPLGRLAACCSRGFGVAPHRAVQHRRRRRRPARAGHRARRARHQQPLRLDWRRPRLDEGVLEMHIVEDQGTLTS